MKLDSATCASGSRDNAFRREAQRLSCCAPQRPPTMRYPLHSRRTDDRLHFDDIAKLLSAFRKLLEGGASLLVIEHNLDVIKSADWLIDLGPEGGDQGGKIIATVLPSRWRAMRSRTRALSRASAERKRPGKACPNGASKPAGASATIANGAKIPLAEP